MTEFVCEECIEGTCTATLRIRERQTETMSERNYAPMRTSRTHLKKRAHDGPRVSPVRTDTEDIEADPMERTDEAARAMEPVRVRRCWSIAVVSREDTSHVLVF